MEASDITTNGNGQPEEEYEPKFDRLSVHRRVLMHVSDEDHVGRGPRNTAARLHQELAEDPYTQYGEGDDVQEYLDDLEAHGLVEKRDDGTYGWTEAGRYEITH